MVTWRWVVIAARTLDLVLGGPVFILATLFNLTAKLMGTIGGGINWTWVLPAGNGYATLGGAFSGSTGISPRTSFNSFCRVFCYTPAGGAPQAGDR